MNFAGNALVELKTLWMKGISDLLMQHPLAKLGIIKGEELLGGFTNFLNEKGISDTFMNLGKVLKILLEIVTDVKEQVLILNYFC